MKKLKRISCLLFAVIMMVTVTLSSSVTANADVVDTVLNVTNYFIRGRGINYTSYGDASERDLSRWDTHSTFLDQVMGEEYNQNRQYTFYANGFTSAINSWEDNIGTIVNNINKVKDESVFNSLKSELDELYSNYIGNVRSGSHALLNRVTSNSIMSNNQAINDCQATFATLGEAMTNLTNRAMDAVGNQSFGSSLEMSMTDLFNIPESLWDFLGTSISNSASSDSSMFGLSLSTINTVAENMLPYINVLAYLILIIGFGISLSHSSLESQLTTPRGAVRIFMEVGIAKLWVDLSLRLCLLVIKLINSIAAQAVSSITDTTIFNGTSIIDILTTLFASMSITPLSIVSALIQNLPNIIIAIVLIVCIVKVMIRLVTRNFELACFLVLSPAGFASAVSEATRPYFRKFLGAFINATLQILLIAVTFNVVSVWISAINASSASFISSVGNEWLVMIIVCAMSRFVNNPPESISNIA